MDLENLAKSPGQQPELDDPAKFPGQQPRLLERLMQLDHAEFVDCAYRAILRRPPTVAERDAMLHALINGATKSWLLGTIAFAPGVGLNAATELSALRTSYGIQRLFKAPLIGAVLEWFTAALRLPRSLVYWRANVQLTAGRLARIEHAMRSRAYSHAEDRRVTRVQDNGSAVVRGSDVPRQLEAELEKLRHELAIISAREAETRQRLYGMLPNALDDTLLLKRPSLLEKACERTGISRQSVLAGLPTDARYTLFQSVFYESPVVEAKQRIYVPFVDRHLARCAPFLDLGCGRGEFLRILQEAGIAAIGVDVNQCGTGALAPGADIAHEDVLEFLERNDRQYSGAAILQVVEHLNDEKLERLLAVLRRRLLGGAPIIIETPNPLCPVALSLFHTDPTHVRPLPPERLQFETEAAGFERVSMLFQNRVTTGALAGSDPRAYYMDYAVIAYRSIGEDNS